MQDPIRFAPNANVYGRQYYESMYRPHWFLRNARKYRERDEALRRVVRPGPGIRLLEMGSARGDSTFFFAPQVQEAAGIDAAEEAVLMARAEATQRGITNVRFETADARDLSLFPDESFEVVLMADFVEHVLDEVLQPALGEALRVLVAGGCVAIYTPNLDHWAERVKAAIPGLQQPDHIAVRRARDVVSLVTAAGFVLDELFFTASPYPLLGAVDRAFPMMRLCQFRTCVRAVKPASS